MMRSALAAALMVWGCQGGENAPLLDQPTRVGLGPRQPAYLGFPSTDVGQGSTPPDLSGFPQRLSDTGAFADTATMAVVNGIVPYDVQSPLWSDGAAKIRWLSVPEGTAVSYDDSGHLGFPPGTVLVKHFEMALDERFPEQRRRLETRFWIVAAELEQYGVTYRWNDEQTDAELLLASAAEPPSTP